MLLTASAALFFLPSLQVSSSAQLLVTGGPSPGTRPSSAAPHAQRAWADVDGDQLLDVLVLTSRGARLYRNLGDAGFEEGPVELPGAPPAGVVGAAWADFDLDGRPDLFLAGAGGASRLFLNLGAWRFEDRSAELGPCGLAQVISARVLDADGDDLPDLHLDTDQGSALMHNEGAHAGPWMGFKHIPLPQTPPAAVRRSSAPNATGGQVIGEPAPRAAGLDATEIPGRDFSRAGERPSRSPSAGRGSEARTQVDAAGAGRLPGASVRDLIVACAATLQDEATGVCISASSFPELGHLYPLSEEFFIDPAGQVGVGTLTPVAPLDVHGNGVDALRIEQGSLHVSVTSSVTLEGAGASPLLALTSFGGDTLSVGSGSWDSVRVGQAGSLTVEASGAVGVNQPTPVAALDVQGDGIDAIRVEQGAVRLTSTASLKVEDSGLTAQSAVESFGTDELYVGSGNWSAVRVGPASTLTVDNTGAVGINQPNPAAALDVQGDGIDGIRVEQGAVRLTSTSSLKVEDSGLAAQSAVESFGTDELYLGSGNWNAIRVGPASTLTVDNTGAVGVNQPNPAAALDVQGDGIDAIRVEQGAVHLTSTASLKVEDSGLAAQSAVESFGTDELYVGSGNWNAVRVGPASTLTVDNTGAVGVNQPNPAAALDVQGDGIDAIRVEQGAVHLTSTASLKVEDSGLTAQSAVESFGTDELYVGSGNWNAVRVGPASTLTVDNTGAVGINQPNPAAALDVQGDGIDAIRVEQGAVHLTSTASLKVEDSGLTAQSAIESFGTDELYVGAGNWNRIRVGPANSITVNALGAVGINQPTPTAALDVQGDGIDGIRVEQGAVRLTATSSLQVEGSGQVPHSAVESLGGDNLYLGSGGWDTTFVGPATTLSVTDAGRVGIGVATPGNILTVEQGSATDPIADAWTTYSSRRWKKDIETFEGALGKIEQLRGVRYRWKESEKPDVGFIAEEVGAVLPELVHFEENGIDARSVDYARMTAVLVQAVKEQQQLIETLRADLDELRSVGDGALVGGR